MRNSSNTCYKLLCDIVCKIFTLERKLTFRAPTWKIETYAGIINEHRKRIEIYTSRRISALLSMVIPMMHKISTRFILAMFYSGVFCEVIHLRWFGMKNRKCFAIIMHHILKTVSFTTGNNRTSIYLTNKEEKFIEKIIKKKSTC